MIIKRVITITLTEDLEQEWLGIEVSVGEGLTTMEAVGLMEAARVQYLQSRHTQGPTLHQSPDGPS